MTRGEKIVCLPWHCRKRVTPGVFRVTGFRGAYRLALGFGSGTTVTLLRVLLFSSMPAVGETVGEFTSMLHVEPVEMTLEELAAR